MLIGFGMACACHLSQGPPGWHIYLVGQPLVFFNTTAYNWMQPLLTERYTLITDPPATLLHYC